MRDVFGCHLTAGNQVEHSFAQSLAALTSWDESHDRRLLGGTVWVKQCNSGGIFTGRNEMTKKFMESSAEWLWMVDSDMGFRPDALSALLATAREEMVPMAGALCFTWNAESGDGMGGYWCVPRPTIYGHDGTGFKAVKDYGRNSVVKAAATGAAFLVIRRSVIAAIQAEHGEHWWTPMMSDDSGQFLGEDLSFFMRAGLAGQRLIIDTSVRTTHAKTIHLSEQHFDLWQDGGAA